MKPMSDQMSWLKYTFEDHTGYLVAPWLAGATKDWVCIRNSASVPPWVDGDIHLHTDAEEYYFVFQGELRLLIDRVVLTLRPDEALLVRPHVPHSMVGGRGPSEHFVLRIPAYDDRETVGEVPPEVSLPVGESERALQLNWGCRVSLTRTRFQNCWLFGVGQARFRSDHICLAYLDLPTEQSAHANWRSHPNQWHAHRESWEFYTVLVGKKTLRIDDELVEIEAGEILEVPPGVKHVPEAIETPSQGFTFRAPRPDDKVVA
ncbi:MAG: cupin domain-containing protein [Anaerolineae bacterium]|jgi:mannose-6-phosphate isomerase-like protein (cupin superfamily)